MENNLTWKTLEVESPIPLIIFPKFLPIKIIHNDEETKFSDSGLKRQIFAIEKDDSSRKENLREEEQKEDMNKKKKGRKKQNNFKIEIFTKNQVHSKFTQDNIKRKIKTHFHFFMNSFLNMKIKEAFGTQKYKIRKVENSITQDISISGNKALFQKTLKEILMNVSIKFRDKESNKNHIAKILSIKPNLKVYFDMKYKDFFVNYYLTSKTETFNNYPANESFEAHLNLILAKEGAVYAAKFKEQANTFIDCYEKGKEKLRRRVKETLE